MKHLNWGLRSLALLVLWCGAMQADTIVSVQSSSTNTAVSARLTAESAFATGWTQTGSYQNVSVGALLFGNNTPGSGIAYLMNSIGAGTTAANQIASASFSVPAFGSPFTSGFLTLFSGLTLGPGTYYLVLTGDSPNFATEVDWRMDLPIAFSTDAGVSLGDAADCVTSFDPAISGFNGGCGFPLSAYVPASPFLDMNNANPPIGCPSCRFNILVTGDLAPVPEPSTILLIGSGLVGVIGKRRRKG